MSLEVFNNVSTGLVFANSNLNYLDKTTVEYIEHNLRLMYQLMEQPHSEVRYACTPLPRLVPISHALADMCG